MAHHRARHIFISYAREDASIVAHMEHRLKSLGFHVWIDTSALRGGSSWREDIDKAISSAGAVVVLKSPASDASTYVVYEWALALGLGQPVIPINYDSNSSHPRLRTIHHLDYHGDDEKFWRELEVLLNEVFDPLLQAVRLRAADLDSPSAKDRIAALEYLVQMDHPAAKMSIDSHLRSAGVVQAIETAEAISATNSPLVVDVLYSLLLKSSPAEQKKISAVLAKYDCSAKCLDMLDKVLDTQNGSLRHLFCEILASNRTKADEILRAIPTDGDKERSYTVTQFLWGIAAAAAGRRFSQIASSKKNV